MMHPYEISREMQNHSVSDVARATGLTYPTVARVRDCDASVSLKNYQKVSEYLASLLTVESDTSQTSS
jgi:hypothetical protein